MSYNPSIETAALLAQAHRYVTAAPYQVTARWVFYRLLQDGLLTVKSDYKRLLSYLSKARKGFYGGWTPYILTDDTRGATVRGLGFVNGQAWVQAIKEQTECNLDRWEGQDNYVEVWFEAAAMFAQFEHYTDPNVPLLAFHGDISIPEKWKAAKRIVDRWLALGSPTKIFYFGDLDEKGLQIPRSAETDVLQFAAHYWWRERGRGMSREEFGEAYTEFSRNFEFTRVGLNDEHIAEYNIPENPERPGTYQWEGLDDAAAQELIGQVTEHLNLAAFDAVEERERDITDQFRTHLDGLELEDDDQDDEEE